jgi:putative addiction module component (TIGR02574 family)
MIWASNALNICGKSREEMEQLSVLSELKRFSIAEKIIIVEELWNRIAADQESFGLTGEQRDELDKRVADYYASPDDGCSWEDVKSRIKCMK